jgi:3-phosphoshikimate 1-carboxyvinyltransferase
VNYQISPAKKFRGRWRAAGDKSITHRAFLFNALAHGEAIVSNANGGEDCAHSRDLVRALGATIEPVKGEKGRWRVEGCGGRFTEPADTLEAGNSGTTLRLACGLLAAQPFSSRLDGDDSLRSRPMTRIAEPLAALGAELSMSEQGTAPLSLGGAKLSGCEYESKLSSAQVKSAFLLAALQASGDSSYREPVLSRDHSERLLARMGAEIIRDETGRLSLSGPQELRAVDVAVPGDISSAAFLIAAGLLVEGGNVLVKGLGVNPSRSGFLDVIERMGGRFALYHPRDEAGEPVADLLTQHSPLTATDIEPEELPRLIDEIPLLAVLAARAAGTSHFRGLAELRVKESDRLNRSAELLRAFGAKVEVTGDELVIEGGDPVKNFDFDSGGDHRLAMSAGVVGLLARGESRVLNVECVATSFPEYASLMKRFSGGAIVTEVAK